MAVSNGLEQGIPADARPRHIEMGSRRYHQKILLSDLIWAIVSDHRQAVGFYEPRIAFRMRNEASAEREVFRTLDQFFNHAIPYPASGFEQAALMENCELRHIA